MSEQISETKSDKFSPKLQANFIYSPESWPKTFEGVTDWEKIFEHPDAGFVNFVQSVQNAEQLKEAMLISVTKLFTRNDEKAEVAQFIADLENIFTNCDFEESRDAIVVLFRNIRDLRIEETEAFLERKRQGRAKERRGNSRSDKGLSLAPFKFIKLNKQETGLLFGSFSLAVAACVIGLIVLVGFDNFVDLFRVSHNDPKAMSLDARQTPPKATLTSPNIPSDKAYGFTVEAPVVYLNMRPDDGNGSYRAYFQPTLYLINDEERIVLCQNWPLVLDALNQVLNRVLPNYEGASEVHLSRANRLAARVINRTLGTDTVTWVSYEPTKSLQEATQQSPPLCRVKKA